MNLEDLMQYLEDFGVRDVLLPFFLIFVIFYATLQKTNILGEGKRNFNIIISFVVASTVVSMHVLGKYPDGYDVVEFLNMAIPYMSLILVAFIMMFILIGLFGAEVNKSSLLGVLGIIILIELIVPDTFIIALILGTSDNLPPWLQGLYDTGIIWWIVAVGVFLSVIWFITREK